MDSPGLCWVLLVEQILITPFPLMSSLLSLHQPQTNCGGRVSSTEQVPALRRGLAWQLPSSLLPHPRPVSAAQALAHGQAVGLVRLSCFWHGLLRGRARIGRGGRLGAQKGCHDRKPGSGALRPGPLCMAQLALRRALAGVVLAAALSLHGHLGAEAARMWLWLWCDARGPRWEGIDEDCSLLHTHSFLQPIWAQMSIDSSPMIGWV